MCCGVPTDLYDLVVVADDWSTVSAAFAEAFLARDRRERVAVVLPRDARTHRLRDYLDLSEIVLIEGHARRDGEHYLEVDGRLIYAECMISTPISHEDVAGRA